MYHKLLEKKTSQLKLKLIAKDHNVFHMVYINVKCIHFSLDFGVMQLSRTSRTESL